MASTKIISEEVVKSSEENKTKTFSLPDDQQHIITTGELESGLQPKIQIVESGVEERGADSTENCSQQIVHDNKENGKEEKEDVLPSTEKDVPHVEEKEAVDHTPPKLEPEICAPTRVKDASDVGEEIIPLSLSEPNAPADRQEFNTTVDLLNKIQGIYNSRQSLVQPTKVAVCSAICVTSNNTRNEENTTLIPTASQIEDDSFKPAFSLEDYQIKQTRAGHEAPEAVFDLLNETLHKDRTKIRLEEASVLNHMVEKVLVFATENEQMDFYQTNNDRFCSENPNEASEKLVRTKQKETLNQPMISPRKHVMTNLSYR